MVLKKRKSRANFSSQKSRSKKSSKCIKRKSRCAKKSRRKRRSRKVTKKRRSPRKKLKKSKFRMHPRKKFPLQIIGSRGKLTPLQDTLLRHIASGWWVQQATTEEDKEIEKGIQFWAIEQLEDRGNLTQREKEQFNKIYKDLFEDYNPPPHLPQIPYREFT